MQTVRDCIKAVIKHSLRAVNESPLLETRLYDDFRKEHKIPKSVLDKSIKVIEYVKPARMLHLPIPTLEERTVLEVAAKHFDVTIEDILGKRRFIEMVSARRVYMVILHIYFDYKLVKTGLKLARDHSTVIHAIQVHDNLLQSDPKYRMQFKKILEELREQIPHAFIENKKETIMDIEKAFNRQKWAAMLARTSPHKPTPAEIKTLSEFLHSQEHGS